MAFSLPRSRLAALKATRPSTCSAASMTYHWRCTSLALAENVLMALCLEKGGQTRWPAFPCQRQFHKKCERAILAPFGASPHLTWLPGTRTLPADMATDVPSHRSAAASGPVPWHEI